MSSRFSSSSSYSEYVRERYNGLSKAQKDDLESFCEWLDQVESIVEEEIGYVLSDLPDQPYNEFFDENISAEIVAENVIKEWKAEMKYMF